MIEDFIHHSLSIDHRENNMYMNTHFAIFKFRQTTNRD